MNSEQKSAFFPIFLQKSEKFSWQGKNRRKEAAARILPACPPCQAFISPGRYR